VFRLFTSRWWRAPSTDGQAGVVADDRVPSMVGIEASAATTWVRHTGAVIALLPVILLLGLVVVALVS
jgi:hypothetical protein